MRRPAPAPPLKSLPYAVQQEIEEFAAFIKQVCDQFGAEPWTGYAVAGEFAQGLAREWAEKQGAALGGGEAQ